METLRLKLSDFDGPLDLLLTLIKENKMEIEKVDIVKLATQYLNFIYSQQDYLQIDEASEYLLMASTLVWLKSKTMMRFAQVISADEQNQIDYERQKFINQIIEYKKYRDKAAQLLSKYEKRSHMASKSQDDIENLYGDLKNSTIFKMPNQVNIKTLHKAMLVAYEKWKLTLFHNHQIVVQEVSAEDVIKDIKKILLKYKTIGKISLSDFLLLIESEKLTDQYFVTCFVCLLDLTKNDEVKLIQANFDDEIYLEINGKIGAQNE